MFIPRLDNIIISTSPMDLNENHWSHRDHSSLTVSHIVYIKTSSHYRVTLYLCLCVSAGCKIRHRRTRNYCRYILSSSSSKSETAWAWVFSFTICYYLVRTFAYFTAMLRYRQTAKRRDVRMSFVLRSKSVKGTKTRSNNMSNVENLKWWRLFLSPSYN